MTPLLNAPSEVVMKKLGMRKEPKTFLHYSMPAQHPLAEHLLYRLSRDQWQTSRQGPELVRAQ